MTEAKAHVAIVISTFNGELFLAEQIDSILQQDHSHWTLFIRDDGSEDTTRSIIQSYCTKDDRIKEVASSGIYLGVKESFFALLQEVAKHQLDYTVLADQDDVWCQGRLSNAVNGMQTQQSLTTPCLVYTPLQVTDGKLKPIEKYRTIKARRYQPAELIMRNCLNGCGMMINQPLLNLLNLKVARPKCLLYHDWWLAILAAFCGDIIMLAKPGILYRQHGNNVVGVPKNLSFDGVKRKLHILSRPVKKMHDMTTVAILLKTVVPDNTIVQYYENLKNLTYCKRIVVAREAQLFKVSFKLKLVLLYLLWFVRR